MLGRESRTGERSSASGRGAGSAGRIVGLDPAFVDSRLLQAIVEAAPDGVLAVSPERRILAVNREFQRLWGLSDLAVEVGGPSPALADEQLAQLADPAAFQSTLEWGHRHPEEVQRLDVALRDGRTFEGFGAPILGEGGDYLGRVWFVHDVTAERAAEARQAALTERLELAERSQRFLLEAADALARASGFSETLASLARAAVPTLGDLCLIDVLDEDGTIRRVAAVHADPSRRRLAERLRAWPPDPTGNHPAARVMRERRSHWGTEMAPGFLAVTTRTSEHLHVLEQLDFRSYMAVPFIADGQVLGAVTFVSSGSGRLFGPSDLSLAEDLAGRLALVVAKERRYDEERQAAHALQANLLPAEVPSVPGLEIAVRYLPSTGDAEVGGDFWDVDPQPGGDVALVIGDVAGHDMIAAAQMAQLRSVLRALRPQCSGPADLIERVQLTWDQLGLGRIATAVFARLEPGSGRLRIASAGHPPPVVVADGETFLPDVLPVPPFGGPSRPPHTWESTLPPGGALVFFTDGLVESRRRSIDEGLELLLAAVREAPSTDPDVLADHLLAALTTESRGDDIAVMTARRTDPAP